MSLKAAGFQCRAGIAAEFENNSALKSARTGPIRVGLNRSWTSMKKRLDEKRVDSLLDVKGKAE